ncbi:MAG: membrane protein insertion efficiency factor YidD [Bacilli bacterium]|nr:MAG: membrane protein insertion efficiency factor YidD [Bacilli bacterium]
MPTCSNYMIEALEIHGLIKRFISRNQKDY